MDQAIIDDLKQFITATILQQTAGMVTKDDLTNLTANLATKQDIAQLNQRIDGLEQSVSEALSTSNDAVDTQLEDHEQRLVKLESTAT